MGIGKPVLDACCGSRMFWFDPTDPRAVFMDNRNETHWVMDIRGGTKGRHIHIAPTVMASFTAIPFEDSTFSLVIFDPPHLTSCGESGWQAKKYGKLPKEWREYLAAGFRECFRVLRPDGTLIFKWNEHNVSVSKILELTPKIPLFGQRCGATAKTHWIVFMKEAA